MIITCEKCSTQFNLNDEMLKDDGSKVRCSVCKHVFTVYPAEAEPQEAPAPLADAPAGEAVPEEAGDFALEDTDFALEGTSDISIEEEELSVTPDEESQSVEGLELEIDEDLSFDEESGELDFDTMEDDDDAPAPALEFAAGSGDDDEDVDFDGLEFETYDVDDEPIVDGLDDEETDLELDLDIDDDAEFIAPVSTVEDDDTDPDDDFELEFDVADEDQATVPALEDRPDDFQVASETDDFELESLSDDDMETTPLQDLSLDDVPPPLPSEGDFDEYDKVLEQDTEPMSDLDEEAEPEPEVEYTEDTSDENRGLAGRPGTMVTPPSFERESKKSSIGTLLLILILLVFIFFGVYIASLMTGYKIPYISDIKIPYLEQIFKKQGAQVEEIRPVPNQQSVNGKFVTNATAGALFVITGSVENPSDLAYSHIEVTGTLIVEDKSEAKRKAVFCGNIIQEEVLKSGNITDINNTLLNKAGQNNTNVNVKPGAMVPFMIVFSDLPEKLQNFTVRVSGFEKAQK